MDIQKSMIQVSTRARIQLVVAAVEVVVVVGTVYIVVELG